MPITPPFHEFALSYPAFEAVLPSIVERALDDAAATLSPSSLGSERVWRRAVMLKAAHELTMSGLGSGVEAALAGQGLSGFSSVTDGSVSASRPVNGAAGGYETTSYGRALRHLLSYSVVPVVTTGYANIHPLGSPVTMRE